jgi:hypothetical protein
MSRSTVVDEIKSAMGTLLGRGLRVSAVLLEPQQGQRIYHDVVHAFVSGGDRRWWWESFSRPSCARHFDDGTGWQKIPAVVPDQDQSVWFIAEDNALPHYPVFETTAAAASRIVGECYGFEYYIVAKDLSWLVCENHHNTVIAVGEQVMPRLTGVAV